MVKDISSIVEKFNQKQEGDKIAFLHFLQTLDIDTLHQLDFIFNKGGSLKNPLHMLKLLLIPLSIYNGAAIIFVHSSSPELFGSSTLKLFMTTFGYFISLMGIFNIFRMLWMSKKTELIKQSHKVLTKQKILPMMALVLEEKYVAISSPKKELIVTKDLSTIVEEIKQKQVEDDKTLLNFLQALDIDTLNQLYFIFNKGGSLRTPMQMIKLLIIPSGFFTGLIIISIYVRSHPSSLISFNNEEFIKIMAGFLIALFGILGYLRILMLSKTSKLIKRSHKVVTKQKTLSMITFVLEEKYKTLSNPS